MCGTRPQSLKSTSVMPSTVFVCPVAASCGVSAQPQAKSGYVERAFFTTSHFTVALCVKRHIKLAQNCRKLGVKLCVLFALCGET